VRGYCDDCGCAKYNGACTNCHEEIYIEEQCHLMDEPPPVPISEKASEQREEIKRKKKLLEEI
jgi:hypothetical protein